MQVRLGRGRRTPFTSKAFCRVRRAARHLTGFPTPALFTLHSSLFTLHSSLFTLHSSLFTLHSSLFTLHSSLFTLHSSLFTLHSLLFTSSDHPPDRGEEHVR